ncbi:MAG: T9SS type A sorting domain-containing protein [bacterium]
MRWLGAAALGGLLALGTANAFGVAGTEEEHGEGPERERRFFAEWHEPYGTALPREYLDDTWARIEALPSDSDAGRSVNAWQFLGPAGIPASGGAKFSGRVLDLEIDSGLLRVGSASGGLWRYGVVFPVAMSDNLSSLAVSTFATDPTNANRVLLGTGEYFIRGGTGLWETNDLGATWDRVPLFPEPLTFFKLRFAPNDPNVVHAATSTGFHRSTDGGRHWTRTLDGIVTDFAVCRDSPNVIYAGKIGSGLYLSLTGGASWVPLSDLNGNLPTIDIGRIAVAVSATNPAKAYSAWTSANVGTTAGVFVTDGAANEWLRVSPDLSFHGFQGWYNNTIECSPTNDAVVLVGGVRMFRSTTSGATWTEITQLHADHHRLEWHANGIYVWSANDGGWAYSSDAGSTWTTVTNTLPITQFYYLGQGVSDPGRIGGGTQDNGTVYAKNSSWVIAEYGDGGDLAVDPADPTHMWHSVGVYLGPKAFKRWRTTDDGVSWTESETGIDPNGDWFPQIEHDQVAPVYLFTNAGTHVYRSTDGAVSWTKLNSTPFTGAIWNMSVARWSSGNTVWVCLDTAVSGNRVWVFDGLAWSQRDTGIAQGVAIQRVRAHPTNPLVAHALVQGVGDPARKLYETTDRGLTWRNITGDLPNVPLSDIVAHPTDPSKLYLGSEMGFYRTTDGGVHWSRWNNGMPQACIATELTWDDDLATTGEFWVVAATFGRGFWRREIAGDDPVDVADLPLGTKAGLELGRVFPNPARDRATIEFTIPATVDVTLRVFDVSGREVSVITRETLETGHYQRDVDTSRWSSGVYFARLDAGGQTLSRGWVVTH